MSRRTVLVVEDDRITALDLQKGLERLGYRVLGAVSTGKDAVDLAAQADMVLMDIRLEGAMDGIEAAAAIRRKYDVPIIFLTVLTDLDILRQALSIEPSGYLVKPFESAELRSSLEIALCKHAAERALRNGRDGLQTILDSLPCGVFVLQDGVCCFANPFCAELLGCEPAHMPPQGPLGLVHAEHRATAQELLALSAADNDGEVGPWRRTLLLADVSGQEVWCDVSARPFVHEGRPALACAIKGLPGRH